jgi:ATP-dependent Clp protease ATP-binding subunit ClpA
VTYSEEVEAVLNRAFLLATEAGHAEMTPEHVVLELIAEEETAIYLERCGTDLAAVESRLRETLGEIEPDAEGETLPSSVLSQVLDAAMERAEEDGRECLMLRDLFLALLEERDSTASLAILEATREPEVFDDLKSYPWEDE